MTAFIWCFAVMVLDDGGQQVMALAWGLVGGECK